MSLLLQAFPQEHLYPEFKNRPLLICLYSRGAGLRAVQADAVHKNCDTQGMLNETSTALLDVFTPAAKTQGLKTAFAITSRV